MSVPEVVSLFDGAADEEPVEELVPGLVEFVVVEFVVVEFDEELGSPDAELVL